jgi:glucokinase
VTVEPYFVGVDVGGTQLRLAAVRRDGTLVREAWSRPTGRDFGPPELLRELRALLAELQQALPGDPAGIGLGIAGVVGRGPLTQSVNLPLLNGSRIEEIAQAAAGRAVALENDARCFTLAEGRFGAGRGARDVCGLTLGTGIGCGIMLGGRLRPGAHSQAGEVWQMPLRGQTLEHFLSGAGVVRAYREAGGDPGLDAARIATRARAGEGAARGAWEAFGDDLAIACEMLITIVDPEAIVIGGSLALAGDLYRPAVQARLARHPTRLLDAELGAAAGVVGAAALNIG